MVEEKNINELRLQAVLAEYEDLRDEIKRRIIGREALFVALMTALGVTVAFILQTRSYYYVVILALITLLFIWHILSSYTIHKIITFYIAKFLERRKLASLVGWHDSRKELDRRIGWIDFENFYEDAGLVVGIRVGLYVLFSVSVLILSAVVVQWQTNTGIVEAVHAGMWWVAPLYWVAMILASVLIVRKLSRIRRMPLELTRVYCKTSGSNIAVFLDRDGVINLDIAKVRRNRATKGTSKYGITSWGIFEFERRVRRGLSSFLTIGGRLVGPRDVRAAIRRFNRVGWKVILVTNQEVVGRGLLTEEGLKGIHRRMLRSLRARLTRRGAQGPFRRLQGDFSFLHGCEVTDIFYCPHHPDIECPCRKPRIGLFRRAERKYRITPNESWIIGDSNKDVAAGQAFGCNSILLTTTYSLDHLRSQDDWVEPTHVSPDLLSAAEWLIRNFDTFLCQSPSQETSSGHK